MKKSFLISTVVLVVGLVAIVWLTYPSVQLVETSTRTSAVSWTSTINFQYTNYAFVTSTQTLPSCVYGTGNSCGFCTYAGNTYYLLENESYYTWEGSTYYYGWNGCYFVVSEGAGQLVGVTSSLAHTTTSVFYVTNTNTNTRNVPPYTQLFTGSSSILYVAAVLLIAVIGSFAIMTTRRRSEMRSVEEVSHVGNDRVDEAKPAEVAGVSGKFCRECGARIPRDSVFCEECGANLSGNSSKLEKSVGSEATVTMPNRSQVPSSTESTGLIDLTQQGYGPADVIAYLQDRIDVGDNILVDSSGDFSIKSGVSSRQIIESVKDVKPSFDGYRGRIAEGQFTLHPYIPFFWGRQRWIAFAELKAKPDVVRKLGVDNTATRGTLDRARQGLAEPNPKARRMILDRVDTIEHLGAYPPEYQKQIFFGEIATKDYSLATRIGYACMPFGFLVGAGAYMFLLGTIPSSGFGIPILLVGGLIGAFYAGVGVGGEFEKTSAKRGVVYRRNTTRWWILPS